MLEDNFITLPTVGKVYEAGNNIIVALTKRIFSKGKFEYYFEDENHLYGPYSKEWI